MIINNFDIMRVVTNPAETNAPLVIDSNAVLTDTVTRQLQRQGLGVSAMQTAGCPRATGGSARDEIVVRYRGRENCESLRNSNAKRYYWQVGKSKGARSRRKTWQSMGPG